MKVQIPGLNSSGSTRPDAVERVSPGRRIFNDAFITRGKNSSLASFYVTLAARLDAAEQFIEASFKRTGVRPSRTCLFVKACALALRKHPGVNYMLSGSGRKIIKPSSIDIGVSIAGEGTFTPVIVLRSADQKSILEISTWLRQESEKARATEAVNMALLDRLGRFLPFTFLRKLFLRYYINHHRVRRDMVGTFQISMLHGPEVELGGGITFLTTAILGVGGKSLMPCERNGTLSWSPCVRMTLNADHRMVDGMKAVNFGREIVRLLENPEELEDR